MNGQFPVLSMISFLLRSFGWLIVIVGLWYYIGYEGLFEPNQRGHRFTQADLFEILIGLGVSLGGLVVVAIGESILVGLAIEKNTRKA